MKTIAKAILSDSTGKILVLRRSASHPHFAHHLDFPGGEVETGEASLQAVTREIIEETGLLVPLNTISPAHQQQIFDSELHVVYTAQLAEAAPAITLSWEHDQSEWLDPAALLQRPLADNADIFYTFALDYLRSIRH